MSTELLKPGFAYFEIRKVASTDKNNAVLMNKNGERMFKLYISVTDSDGQEAMIFDYISPSTGWKTKQLEKIMDKQYLLQNLFDDDNYLVGTSGMCTVKTNVSKDPQWEDRTVIGNYLTEETVRMLDKSKKDKGIETTSKPKVVSVDSSKKETSVKTFDPILEDIEIGDLPF